VQLAVTPSVNAGDMVAMTLNQSVTDVGPIDAATGQRSSCSGRCAAGWRSAPAKRWCWAG